MKFLIFVAILVAVCGQSAVNVQADLIECDFDDEWFDELKLGAINLYTCEIKSIEVNGNENVIIGSHSTEKSDRHVKAIQIYDNEFMNLTNFDSIFCQKFPNLEIINFDNLHPTSLDANALYSCKHLKQFEFANTGIKQIPENFFSTLENLELLDLSENHLIYLPENIFQSLTKLKTLYLNDNNLTTLSHEWFDNLGNLEELRLSNNKIEKWPKGIFVGLEKLEKLWTQNNNLETIHADFFGKKPKLTVFELPHNRITSVDEKFIDDTAVDFLDMRGSICCDELIESRDKMKEKLQQCFSNYQPR